MDRETFIRIVVPLGKRLERLALRYTGAGEDAQDIAQEVLAKMWTIRDGLENYGSPEALAVQIAKNTCLNHIKREKRKVSLFGRINGETDAPQDDADQGEAREHIRRIVERLPEMQQAVLRMKYLDGLETEEIAELLGCTREAVWANLSRARKKAKELFDRK